MAFTKFNKVVVVKYGGAYASHPYISSKQAKKITLRSMEDGDPFTTGPWGPRYKQCNTRWKMSKDKKKIYAICPHKIKFVLDESNNG